MLRVTLLHGPQRASQGASGTVCVSGGCSFAQIARLKLLSGEVLTTCLDHVLLATDSRSRHPAIPLVRECQALTAAAPL